MNNKHTNNAKIFKAFCDENRLMILEMLQSGEKCACHLLEDLDITQPTLSHHMKILCESGIVTSRRQGKWMYYTINEFNSQQALKLLKELLTVSNDLNLERRCCD